MERAPPFRPKTKTNFDTERRDWRLYFGLILSPWKTHLIHCFDVVLCFCWFWAPRNPLGLPAILGGSPQSLGAPRRRNLTPLLNYPRSRDHHLLVRSHVGEGDYKQYFLKPSCIKLATICLWTWNDQILFKGLNTQHDLQHYIHHQGAYLAPWFFIYNAVNHAVCLGL